MSASKRFANRSTRRDAYGSTTTPLIIGELFTRNAGSPGIYPGYRHEVT
jgi:hypothetical protein